MFKKILIANRGGNGRKAVAAKPNCVAREARGGRVAREARAGEFPAEMRHV